MPFAFPVFLAAVLLGACEDDGAQFDRAADRMDRSFGDVGYRTQGEREASYRRADRQTAPRIEAAEEKIDEAGEKIEGTFERAGSRLDRAGQRAGDRLDRAGRTLDATAERAGDRLRPATGAEPKTESKTKSEPKTESKPTP